MLMTIMSTEITTACAGKRDAYGEWQLGRQGLGRQAGGRQDSLGLARQQQLEQQLRSPRGSGGHAASRP